MKVKKPRPRGRPALPKAEKKTVNFTFRSRAELREKLAEAATANGRSISEEIEHRLIQSFFTNEIIQTVTEAAIRGTFDRLLRERSEYSNFYTAFSGKDAKGDEK
jgi:Arc-like DNA binding domain